MNADDHVLIFRSKEILPKMEINHKYQKGQIYGI